MTSAETAAPRAPVTLACSACGHEFTSRAARHVTVRCPECGRGIRVKRPRPAGWERRAQRTRSPEHACQEKPPAHTGTVTVRAAPRPLPLSPLQDDQDDDGRAYMRGPDGGYVLADLTPDGRLVPVTLVDQRFRSIAAGYCSVYGCTGPARYLARGWPVCPGCRRELAG